MSEPELPHDAYLKGALKHAPDAGLGPAPDLSAFILREAQAKARDPSTAPRPRTHSLWAWLTSPTAATGFAGVMVAVLVGLVWWDQPMDEAMPRAPGAARAPLPDAAPAAAAEAPAPPVADAAVPPAPQVPVTTARPGPAPKMAAEQARAADKRDLAEARTPAPRAEDRARRESVAGANMADALEKKKLAASEMQAQGAAAEAAPPTAIAAAPTLPLGRQAASGEAVAAAPPPAPAPAMAGRAPSARAMAPAEAEPRSAATAAPSVAGGLSLARRDDSAAAPALAALRLSLAAEPAAWAWQRGEGGSPQALREAVPAWLAQLERSSGARWQARPAALQAAPGRELRLLHHGTLVHRFRLGDAGVDWLHDGIAHSASLDAATRAQLQDALDQAAP